VLVGLGHGQGVHDTHWELDRASDFIIDLHPDFFILHDDVGLTRGQAQAQVVSS
jgi:hypothetical protein